MPQTTATSSIYLAAVEPRSGKSLVALGMMEVLSRRVGRLGYFRPVVSGDDDHRMALMRDRYQLDDRIAGAWTDEQVDSLLAEGREDEVVKGVIEAYRELAERCRFIVIEGSDQTGARTALEFEFNARLASNLGASMVAILRGGDGSPADVGDSARVTARLLADDGVDTTAIVVNRVPEGQVEATREALAELDFLTAAIPEDDTLGMPTHAEVVAALGATEVVGGTVDAEVAVTSVKVAAMTLPNLLDRLEDGALVITPGDRPDVLVGVLTSRISDTQPDVAGILLSGGLEPAPQIMRLLDGLGGVPLPIHAVDSDTWDTATAVHDVPAVIHSGSERKIATALGLFEEHVDIEDLLDRVEVARSDRVTPMMFEYDLIERARSDRRHIVLPEGSDDRILQAATLLRRRNVVDLTILGDPDAIRRRASVLGADLDDVALVEPATSEDLERYAQAYVEARAHKGMVLDRALEVMDDVSYFGTMMVHLGDADGMVSGAANTTAHTIRPAFEFIKTAEGVTNVSSVFLMCLADRVLVYGDCAIIPNPTPEQLADIAVSSAGTAAMFDIEPIVAMLSYSTGGSGAGEDVERVIKATELARAAAPDLPIEGPIQYDAAVDAGVGAKKLPESSVAGRATVFVFPDLNTGNNTYKAVQRSSGAVAIGPVLQGLRKPVNDLSRGCLVADIVNTVAITAIQSQQAEG